MKCLPALLALLAALPLAGCSGKAAAGETAATNAPPAAASVFKILAVRATPAATRTFERRLAVQGTLEATRFAKVSARTAGNLEAVFVDEGDRVVAGETKLFQIDPVSRSNQAVMAEESLAVTRASLAVAKAQAGKARAEARKAALDLERYTRLHNQARVSDNEFETHTTLNAQGEAAVQVADAQVALAERQVRQAEAALAIARKNLDDALVLAPLSGVVSARLAEPGEQMDVGRVILRLDDPSAIEAAAFLPAPYYADVVPGRTRFRLEVNGRDAGSHPVLYRSPTVNTTLRTFEIKGAVEGVPADLAVPGSMAALTLVFESREGLAVPSSSVLQRGGRPVVFLALGGRAVRREVETGLQNDGWTEIRSGLAAGEAVVTEGQSQLDDGLPVSLLP